MLCYNIYMETKIVKLKNGIKAILMFVQIDDYYMIYAKDSSNKVVGNCNFDIVMNYVRELSNAQREMYAKTHKIKIDNVPNRIFAQGSPKKFQVYPKNGDEIKIGNNIYTNFNNYCELNKIEINDTRYHRVGLGSAMLNFVIEFVKQYKCERIDAFVYPNGEFQFSTLEFYKRNGFIFQKNSYATKQLNTVEKINTLV